MNNFQFLSVTNKHFIPIVKDLLISTDRYHPDIPFNLVCVNLQPIQIDYLRSLHENLQPIIVNQKFKKVFSDFPRHYGPKDTDHEEGYCTSCRSWFAAEVMEKYNTSVFYLDADVYIKGSIRDLFADLNSADFMIRAKGCAVGAQPEREKFKCNAGMVWIKNSTKNLKLLNIWAEKTRKKGIGWRSNQWALNELMIENWNDIIYKNFPSKFNGIKTPEGIIRHAKGRGAHKRSV